MLFALYISGVVPSKIFLIFNLCHHRLNPSRVGDGFESYILRSLYSWVSCIVALHSIAAIANAAFNFGKLGACFTLPRWQAVRQSRHFTGSGHRSGYLFCFFYFHNSHNIPRLCTCQACGLWPRGNPRYWASIRLPLNRSNTLRPSGNCLPVHQGLRVINSVFDPRSQGVDQLITMLNRIKANL